MSRRWRSAGPWMALLVLSATALARAPQARPVVIIRLEDTVQPVSAEYVTRGLDYAAGEHAAAVVLTLSTPGGLDSSMRAIIQKILASPVPVIGYVAPSGARAASAGFYILMSCDLAAMAPGTNTGAAHPVTLGGAQPDKIEAAKIQNDAAAYIRTLAGDRHRNATLAQKAVVDSASFTAQEALKGGLIDLISPSVEQLLHSLDGRTIERAGELKGAQQTLDLAGAPRQEFAMSLRERVLDMSSGLAFVLLVAGALLIYIEFTHPGVIVPGVAGVIMAVLALFSLSLLPISWAGAGLLLLAMVLFVLEAKFPSHGVMAAGGVAAMALGAAMLVDSPVPQMRVGWSIAVGTALGFGLVSMFLVELVVRARRRRVVTGAQGLLGESGLALSPLDPAGTVSVHGERWRAVATAPLPAGAPIRVRAIRGLELEVEPLAPPVSS